MTSNRVFFSQEAVDRWLADGRVNLEGEVLGLLPNGPAFLLSSAVLFQAEVGSGDDVPGLCGKVKTIAAVQALTGEHASGSVLLGDYAYEVVDGFLGELLLDTSTDTAASVSRVMESLADLANAVDP
jgi:hypothetical protein